MKSQSNPESEMASLDEFNKARQEGRTVGDEWKRLSESREQLPNADPFSEAARLSGSQEIAGHSVLPFGKDGIEEWNRYLSRGADV